jgi:ADP-heptose:LPS heptosyltransferase
VLVIAPGALGDLMCLIPALEAISRRHPGASIELMSRFELARLAAGRTVVERAHSIDALELGALFSDETPVDPGARRFFADFDRIYSFFAWGDPRFRARLAAATDADVSFHPFDPEGETHISAAHLHAIDATASPTNSHFEPTPDDLAAAARALDQSNADSSHLVVIFPGSGNPVKNWPAEKFAALASTLSKRASVAVILGPAESSLKSIFRDRGVAALKDLDLPTVAAIARLAAAFVGNDSGVSHLAAAVGTAGLAIFGPTDPARWRPLGGRIDILRRNPIDSIEVEEVAAALSKFVT